MTDTLAWQVICHMNEPYVPTLTLLIFWPRSILFHRALISCILLSGCNAICPGGREKVVSFSSLPPLPYRVFLWRRHVTQVVGWLKLLWSSWSHPTINLMCLPWRQMSPFVCNITGNSLNFGFCSILLTRDSENWVHAAIKEYLRLFALVTV